MKIAEGYNLTGNENAMGLKNAILPVLDFAQPYRSNDIWLVSLGLDLTKIDTIYIWELFYGPILLTICSLSLFEIIKKKNNFYFSITFSFLCLFAFAGNWYRNLINLLYPINEGGLDPIGIVTYLKLAIVFTLLFQFFDNYVNQRKIEALYFLILIPLLVQSTIAIFIIVFILISALIFKEYKKSKFNNFKHFIPFISLFLIISLGFVLFYKINQYSEFQIIGATTLNISSNENFLELLIQFFKKSVLLLLSYFWLSIIIAGILIFSNSNFTRKLKIELFLILIVTYFSTILVYAQFNKVGDAYQFSTNIFGPFVLSFIIFLLLKKSNKIQFKYLNIFILFLISGLGFYQICSESNFFQTDKRINFYSKNFINEVKLVLPKVKNPFGIIYYGDNLQNNPREDFPLMDASFLKLFGRNYEVFNIEGNGLKMNLKDKNLQKNNLYIQKNAINIWIKNQSKKTKQNLNSIDFYKHFQFGFCISRITIDKLPAYIKRDITKIIKDDNSKIFFYKLR